jgi:hypothetical protein
MSHEPHAVPPTGHAEVGHEQSDLSVMAITIFGIVLTGVLIAALVSMAWLFGFFESWEARQDAPPSPLAAVRSGPPQPLLQVHPVQDLKALRAAEDKILTGYGWVNKEAGIARIPIARAMELLVERGLPVPSHAPAKAPAPGGPR